MQSESSCSILLGCAHSHVLGSLSWTGRVTQNHLYTAASPGARLLGISHVSMSLGISAAVIVLLASIAINLGKVGRRPPGYPPGPPTWPLIGNLHLMPQGNAHLQFQSWAQEYGPVYSLILGTKVMIVVSSDQAVKDLLDKRSGIYSSRPDMYLGNIVSGGLRMLLMVSLRFPCV
jgi:hypothetical protein